MPIDLYIPELSWLCSSAALRQRHSALETLISRAQVQPDVDEHAVLAKAFGMRPGFGVAPFMRLAETGNADSSFIFRADPVHLAPDRDRLVMLPLAVMQVLESEASALADCFNRLYLSEGFVLETPDPQRWYLRMPEAIRCETFPPSRVSGGPVLEFMPHGEHAWRLRQLMNEIQMLFHGQPVNLSREAEGRPCINSLWLWGGGFLPDDPIHGPDSVLTDLPLVTGLARIAGCACADWNAIWRAPPAGETQLIATQCSNEHELAYLEEHLAGPLLQAIQHGTVDELLIYPGDRCGYRVTRSSSRRFWCRRRPLADVLQSS
ncbi:MAG: hypothetical protein KGL13_04380 [Gammaproteobacteria bacterium]|nr:hypothetical protein [Gammaproteobacteria bacterium]MDE2345685.1 hypothetical protein [Gammaproteobacteria bacterium]